jgi:2-keto-3-deoxy-L-rhamnonate aldolase RhmA
MLLPTLKDRWSPGPALGAWLFLREPLTAESAARMGYDYVCIDLQHGYASQVDALAMIQAAASAGTIPVVRVAWNDPTSIGHSLDAGALAVIVPMVNNAEQAARAVAACRYAPEGIRSFGALAALDRYSGDYVQQANAAVCCIPMIETIEAVDNLDEILGAGHRRYLRGPVDLSLTGPSPPRPTTTPCSPTRSTASSTPAGGTASSPASTPMPTDAADGGGVPHDHGRLRPHAHAGRDEGRPAQGSFRRVAPRRPPGPAWRSRPPRSSG